MMLFSGNSNHQLAEQIVNHLSQKSQIEMILGEMKVGNFSDGEVSVELMENVRGQDVFIIQSISSPSNDMLMELLLMVDAIKRSSARSISAVIPYFRVRSSRP